MVAVIGGVGKRWDDGVSYKNMRLKRQGVVLSHSAAKDAFPMSLSRLACGAFSVIQNSALE